MLNNIKNVCFVTFPLTFVLKIIYIELKRAPIFQAYIAENRRLFFFGATNVKRYVIVPLISINLQTSKALICQNGVNMYP
jgi:hypothetical protein